MFLLFFSAMRSRETRQQSKLARVHTGKAADAKVSVLSNGNKQGPALCMHSVISTQSVQGNGCEIISPSPLNGVGKQDPSYCCFDFQGGVLAADMSNITKLYLFMSCSDFSLIVFPNCFSLNLIANSEY